MRYKTVKEVTEFVDNLKANDTADSQLQIRVEFYDGWAFVGEMVKNMCSECTTIALKNDSLLDYFVVDFKIEFRQYCVAFVLSIKEPPSI